MSKRKSNKVRKSVVSTVHEHDTLELERDDHLVLSKTSKEKTVTTTKTTTTSATITTEYILPRRYHVVKTKNEDIDDKGGKARSLYRTASSRSASPPPDETFDNSLTGLLRRPMMNRSLSAPYQKQKGVRFASDANGDPVCTIHEIPNVRRRTKKIQRWIFHNNNNNEAQPPSPPLRQRQQQQLRTVFHDDTTNRPNFQQDLPPSLPTRNRNRFRADTGRDSAPVFLKRKGVMTKERTNTDGEQQQQQQKDNEESN